MTSQCDLCAVLVHCETSCAALGTTQNTRNLAIAKLAKKIKKLDFCSQLHIQHERWVFALHKTLRKLVPHIYTNHCTMIKSHQKCLEKLLNFFENPNFKKSRNTQPIYVEIFLISTLILERNFFFKWYKWQWMCEYFYGTQNVIFSLPKLQEMEKLLWWSLKFAGSVHIRKVTATINVLFFIINCDRAGSKHSWLKFEQHFIWKCV